MNLRNLTFHAHSQWLTLLLDESFGRIQRLASRRNLFRQPLNYFRCRRLKANLPNLLNYYSRAEHSSLQDVAASLMDDSHCLDLEQRSLGADCRAIYAISQHLEVWASSPATMSCNLSENDEQAETECVNELAQYSSIDLVKVTTEASILLADGDSKEEAHTFLNANVKYLPIR